MAEGLRSSSPSWQHVRALAEKLLQRGWWSHSLRTVLSYRARSPDDASLRFLNEAFSQAPLKIWLVMDQGIGNMVMLTPTIRAIKELYPAASLEVIGREESLAVIRGWELVNRCSTCEAVDFSDPPDVLLLSIWSNDFLKAHRDDLTSLPGVILQARTINPNRHEAEHHLDLARALGYRRPLPSPYCHREEVVWPFEENRPVVLLADTSHPSPVWRRKRWPRYRELAQRLLELGYQVGLIGGAVEAREFDPRNWPPGVTSLLGRYSIPQMAYLISRADLFIGNDSGPAHIAGAVGTRTIVIFGPTREKKNRPLGPRVSLLRADIPCRPCQYTSRWNSCERTLCMSSIRVDDVLRTMERLMEGDRCHAL